MILPVFACQRFSHCTHLFLRCSSRGVHVFVVTWTVFIALFMLMQFVPMRVFAEPAGALQTGERDLNTAEQRKGLDVLPYWNTGQQISVDDTISHQQLVCGGYYDLPAMPSTLNSPKNNAGAGESFDYSQNITIYADSASLVEHGYSQLMGNVVIQQGDHSVTAQSARFTLSPRAFELSGNLFTNDGDFAVLAESGEFNAATGQTGFAGAHVIMADLNARAYAERLSRPSAHALQLDNSYYSTCAPSDNSWLMRASRINIDKDSGWGTVNNLRLWVKNVPILYLPYFKFPIDDKRHTGLLYPKFGTSTGNGLSYAQPVYWNINPKYDATFTPRFMSERGFELSSEFRYLLGRKAKGEDNTNAARWGNGVFQSAFLVKDQAANNENRNFFSWEHSLNRKHWGFNGLMEYVSDADYLFDVQPAINVARKSYLSRSLGLHYNLDGGFAQLDFDRYQMLNATTNPYTSEPHFYAQYAQPLDKIFKGLTANLRTDLGYYRLEKDDASLPTGGRYYLETGLSYTYRKPYLRLTPEVKWTYLRYGLRDTFNGKKTPDINLPEVILDGQLYFDRFVNYGKNSWVQTLEPRLAYYYAPNKSQVDLPIFNSVQPSFSYQQLFRHNRYAGFDRVGDSEHVSLALTSRMINTDTGKELYSASLGQSLYLNSDSDFTENDQTNDALWAFRGTLQMNDQWSVHTEATWKDFYDDWQESNLSMSYRANTKALANVGLYYTPQQDKQVQLSGTYKINPNLAIFGQWRHDVYERKTMSDLLGISYESCCWAVRFLAGSEVSKTSDNNAESYVRDNKILLEFELKGLGSVGDDVRKNLVQLIPNYEE